MIWGIWIWLENHLFLRLKVIREIPHFVGFSCNEVLQSEELIVHNEKNENIELFVSCSTRHCKQTLILQSSSFCSFYHGYYPTIWGIWNWIEYREFLRLKEIKLNSPLCMIFSISRSYNLRNLSWKHKLSIPQIEGYYTDGHKSGHRSPF